jgi:hypothetical protein
VLVDVLAIVACAAGAFLSYRAWDQAPRAVSVDDELEKGEGRSRFLGLWGMATALLFAAAIVFDSMALWTMPLCG